MIRVTQKQLAAINVNAPAAPNATIVINNGPEVAEKGTVTADYYLYAAGGAPIKTLDVAPDGTVYEQEV